MTYSDKGLALTKSFEGCRLAAYQDSTGKWTIGYGHTAEVKEGDTCTYDQASDWLQADIQWAVHAVNTLVTFAVNQNQFDALVDFTFNLGSGSLSRSYLLKLVNDGNIEAAAAEFEKWDQAGGKTEEGLLRRRLAERALFLT